MIALSDRAAFLAACDRARSIALSAYVLPTSVQTRLARAARRGASVEVRLAARPVADTRAAFAALVQANRDAVRAIASAGGRARLVPSDQPLHMKAAVVDGVAFLDDRNWSDAGPQTIVRDDDSADVAVVRSALAGVAAGDARLQTVKARSLALERTVIDRERGMPLEVESESFGRGPILGALLARGRGSVIRLIVAQREVMRARMRSHGRRASELRALDALARDGVRIRIADADEKMALGARIGWIGSTNATSLGATAGQLDWGMVIADAAMLAALRARFESTWRAAEPYAAQTAGR